MQLGVTAMAMKIGRMKTDRSGARRSRGLFRLALLGVLLGSSSVSLAGMSDTALPTFSDGQSAQLVGLVPTVVKNNNVETVVICTNLDTASVNIGLEVFDKTGALGNPDLGTIGVDNGAILNVAVGSTVTIATSGTTLLTENETITGLPTLRNGSGRVVGTSRKISCIAMLIDEAHAIVDPALCSSCPPPKVVNTPVWACGNGIVDPFEQCDDGGIVSGDGCDANCNLEGSTSPCASTPETGCRLPIVPGRGATLQLKDKGGLSNQFKWSWKRGEATDKADFKTPTIAGPIYRVCLYDSSVLPQPLVELDVPTGGVCDGRPCWKESSSGFRQKDRSGLPDGVQSLKVRAGEPGRPQVKLKAKGLNLPLPGLPLTFPVIVQLVVDDGGGSVECWQSTFAEALKNDTLTVKAKGPP